MPTLLRRWLCLVLVLSAGMVASAAVQAKTSRALWVWDPTTLLQDVTARQQFLDFCRARGIDTAWVQTTRQLPGESRLQDEDGWRALLGDAHRAGLKIHALDGDPTYVLRERHYVVLGLIDTIIRFNRSAPPGQHFDGFHLDNEPYLLAGWDLPVIREQALTEYLELNAKAQRAVAAEGGLEYGVDIPFWSMGDATFEGVRKPASFHILDLVDNAGIMDYRNVALGDDGIIAHARALLTYGNATKAKMFVGVETGSIASVGLPKMTFDGRSNAEMDHELAVAQAAFANDSSYVGFAIHHYVPYRARFP